jgi:hypothetical protein
MGADLGNEGSTNLIRAAKRFRETRRLQCANDAPLR